MQSVFAWKRCIVFLNPGRKRDALQKNLEQVMKVSALREKQCNFMSCTSSNTVLHLFLIKKWKSSIFSYNHMRQNHNNEPCCLVFMGVGMLLCSLYNSQQKKVTKHKFRDITIIRNNKSKLYIIFNLVVIVPPIPSLHMSE